MSKSELVLQCHAGLLLNEREGTSAIALHFSSICMSVRGRAHWDLRRSAKAYIKCSAMVDFLDAKYVTQPTVGVLSLKSVTHFL